MKDRVKKTYVGIDVSAASLAVCFAEQGRAQEMFEVPNTAAGHRQILRRVARKNRQVRVCLEATGNYSLALSLALHEHDDVEVMVVNPRAAHHFAQANMNRSKNDRVDSVMLLEFGRRMPFEPWAPPAPQAMELRAISRRVSDLTATLVQERARLHSAEYLADSSAITEDLAEHIEQLQERIESLREKALVVIEANRALSQRFALLVTICGIATVSAIQLLGELAILPPDMTAKQWVAHAGLDPRVFESGSSVKKTTRISKSGNPHIRAALYLPAISAGRHQPNVKHFREELLQRGKAKQAANVAIMRKLLHSIHGMFRTGTEFDGSKFRVLPKAA